MPSRFLHMATNSYGNSILKKFGMVLFMSRYFKEQKERFYYQGQIHSFFLRFDLFDRTSSRIAWNHWVDLIPTSLYVYQKDYNWMIVSGSIYAIIQQMEAIVITPSCSFYNIQFNIFNPQYFTMMQNPCYFSYSNELVNFLYTVITFYLLIHSKAMQVQKNALQSLVWECFVVNLFHNNDLKLCLTRLMVLKHSSFLTCHSSQ